MHATRSAWTRQRWQHDHRWPRRPGAAPSARPSSRCPATIARRCSPSWSTCRLPLRRDAPSPARPGAPPARRAWLDEPRGAGLPRPRTVREPLLRWLAPLHAGRATPSRQPGAIEFDAHRLQRAAAPRAPWRHLPPPRGRALAQARHVFLPGNGLPQRWAGRRASWCWRPASAWATTSWPPGTPGGATAALRALWFVAIEKHPPTRDRWRAPMPRSPLPALAGAAPRLAAADARPAPAGLRRRPGAPAAGLRRHRRRCCPICVARSMPSTSTASRRRATPAMWEPRACCRALGRLAAPGATAATWSVARDLRRR